MTEMIRWAPMTLGEIAATAGAALERGDAARRIHAFVVPGRDMLDGSMPALERTALVAVPAGPGAAATLAAVSAAGAVAIVEREQPVPATMSVLRTSGLADAISRLASARRIGSRARVIAIIGVDAATVALPLAAACRRRWRTVSASSPSGLDAALLSLAPATERAIVILDGGDLVSLVADMALASPSIVVAASPRPGDPAPFELAAALPASVSLLLDEHDPRAGLIRQSASFRVLDAGSILGASSRSSVASTPALVAVPARATFACRGIAVTTSLPPSALTAARLAAAAALTAGVDALDISEAFSRLLPASMPLPGHIPAEREDLAATQSSAPLLARTA